jgi:hypothetical protein
MDLTEGSETSEKLNLTPGKYPKENIQDSEHDENLKSRILTLFKDIIQKQTSGGNENIGANDKRRTDEGVWEAYCKLLSMNSTGKSAYKPEQSLGITGQQQKACLKFSSHLTCQVCRNLSETVACYAITV